MNTTPPTPPRPSGNPARASVFLNTRLPGAASSYGAARTLAARGACRRWTAASATALLAQLPEAVAVLMGDVAAGVEAAGSGGGSGQETGAMAGDAGRLLVGVLPYPGGTMPACALLFERHRTGDAGEGFAAHGLPAGEPEFHLPEFRLTRGFAPDWSRAGYEAGVQRVLDYLVAGDAYQVNLAQRFTAQYEGNPQALFAHLHARHRPPYAAWVDTGDTQVLCLSPESFLEVDGDRVLTRPIKGTRPRGDTPEEDARARSELLAAAKDRAENLMIVDLLRNDLGRVCTTGSVQVPALFALESFPNVHHLVSTVEGRLRPDADIPALLAACFPGGSITGAPKRRAMEIIAELEPHPREIYCGTIFWMTADGRFGSNIAIRTLLARNGLLHCWGGAGIVADSDPAREYQECLDKVGVFMRESEAAFLR